MIITGAELDMIIINESFLGPGMVCMCVCVHSLP